MEKWEKIISLDNSHSLVQKPANCIAVFLFLGYTVPVNIRKILKWTIIVLVVAAAITFTIVFILSKTQPQGGTVGERLEKLNPFDGGQNPEDSTDVNPGDGTSGGSVFSTSEPKTFRRIADGPVSGFTVFARPRVQNEEVLDPKTGKMVMRQTTTFLEVARYVEKETGYVYEAVVDADAITVRQLTGTAVPRVEEVAWGKDGETLAMRFADDNGTIQTFYARIPGDQAMFACGTALTANVSDLKKGSKGNAVTDLQAFLGHVLGYTVKADGVFGPGTETRVKEYQALVQAAETGIVDEMTRNSILERCAKEREQADEMLRKPKELAGGLMSENILRMVESPASGEFFYMTQEGTRGAGFIKKQQDGTPVTRIFDSPLSEWVPQWTRPETIFLQTAASMRADGYLFSLDPASSLVKKVLGPLPGLTSAVSPDGAWALTSTSRDGSIQTQLRSLVTGMVTDMARVTLPNDKCVWASDSTKAYCAVPRDIPPADYPDQWYQGITRFNDTVWEISIPSGDTKQILDPAGSYDFIQPRISPNGTRLYLVDKGTGSLWVLNLNI